MITEYDLDAAIAECIGEREPNANTCIKLAAFYTIKQHMFGGPAVIAGETAEPYSYDAPQAEAIVDYEGDSDFAMAIKGRKSADIWPIIDEAITCIEAINPRLYSAIFRRIDEL